MIKRDKKTGRFIKGNKLWDGKKRPGLNYGWNKGKKWKQKSGDKKGKNNPCWRGGVSKDFMHYNRKRRNIKYNADGSHTLREWETLKAQYNWTCPSCGKKEPKIKLNEDHIIPLSKGGSDNIENIQPLCKSCNSKKHTKTIKY